MAARLATERGSVCVSGVMEGERGIRRRITRSVVPMLLLGVLTGSGASTGAEAAVMHDRPGAVRSGEWVSLSAVPLAVRYAVLAAEDPGFYDEPDRGWLGDLTAHLGVDRPDPSPITVRHGGGVDEARRLESGLSRDQILERHLNTGFFGRGAHGIDAAARTYFAVTPDRLTAAQGAVLAAALGDPEAYDPAAHRVAARHRWDEIVRVAAQREWLSVGLTYPLINSAAGPRTATPRSGRG